MQFDRLGLTVSRKVGRAIQRNRIKRIIRDLFRTNLEAEGPFVDLVVRPDPGFLDVRYNDLRRAWRAVIRDIKARLSGH